MKIKLGQLNCGGWIANYQNAAGALTIVSGETREACLNQVAILTNQAVASLVIEEASKMELVLG